MQGKCIRAMVVLACRMALLVTGCSDQATVTDAPEMKKGGPGPPPRARRVRAPVRRVQQGE